MGCYREYVLQDLTRVAAAIAKPPTLSQVSKALAQTVKVCISAGALEAKAYLDFACAFSLFA